MERDGDQLSTRPALETEGLRFLHVTGESAGVAGQRVCAATLGAPPCSVSRSPLPYGPDLAGSRMLALHAGLGGGPEARLEPLPERCFLGRCGRPFFARVLYFMRSKPSGFAVTGVSPPLACAFKPQPLDSVPPPTPPISGAVSAFHGHSFLYVVWIWKAYALLSRIHLPSPLKTQLACPTSSGLAPPIPQVAEKSLLSDPWIVVLLVILTACLGLQLHRERFEDRSYAYFAFV